MEQLYISQTPTWLILIPNIFQVMLHWTVMTRKVWLDWPSNDKSTKKPCRIDFKKWTYEGFLPWHIKMCRNNVKFLEVLPFRDSKWLSGVIHGCYLTVPYRHPNTFWGSVWKNPQTSPEIGLFFGVPFTPGLTWLEDGDWVSTAVILILYSCSFASMKLRSHWIKNKPTGRWWQLKINSNIFYFHP